MTKAFLVHFKPVSSGFGIGIYTNQSNYIAQSPPDNRPLLVIAQTIEQAAKQYPASIKIEEIDVKDVIIQKNIDILL